MAKPTILRTVFLSACLSMAGVFFAATANGDSPAMVVTGTDDARFTAIDSLVAAAIDQGETPGAVVAIANSQSVVFAKAYGQRQVQPVAEAMTLDTVFDLASISKPLSTATATMMLVDQGRIDVSDPVVKHLPEFAPHDKDKVTIEHLLLHTSGLIPDNALGDYRDGREAAWQNVCKLKLRSPPGEKFAYSDVGFIVLGKLVHQISGQRLDAFAADQIFTPLGMHDTTYNPPAELRSRTAATEKRDDQFIKGVVHDPRAHLMEGVAGHAGVFSTASDLVRYGQVMLRKGKLSPAADDTKRLFSAATFDQMIQARDMGRGTRTLGWDHQSPYSRNRGKSLSTAAFGHGGFTGTVLWIDPAKDLVFVFLSTRLHPDGKGSVNNVAGEILTQVGAAW